MLLQEYHSKRMGYLNDKDASTYQSMLSINMRPIQNMTRYNPTPLHTPKTTTGPFQTHGSFRAPPPQPLPEPSGNETGRGAAYLLGAICQMCDVTLERPAF